MKVTTEREYEFQWTVPAEQELGLRDPVEVHYRLATIAAELEASCEPDGTDAFTDRFLDTKHWSLLRGGVGLRNRERGDERMLTLKRIRRSRSNPQGLARHDEWHLDWERSLPKDASQLPPPLREVLEPYVRGRKLRPMLDVKTRRWRTELTLPNGECALLLLDAVHAQAGPDATRSLRESEARGTPTIELPLRVELEFLIDGESPSADALAFAQRFAERSGLQAARHNKLVTAIAALRPDSRRAAAERAERPETAPEFVAQRLRSALHDLHRAESRVRERTSAGRVRRFRIACRRMRAVLAVHAELDPEGPAKNLRNGVRRAARAFGTVRDHDVLIRRLELADEELPPSLRNAAARLRQQLDSDRESMVESAVERLRGRRVQAALRRLDRFIEKLPLTIEGEDLEIAAPALIDRQVVRVLARKDLARSTGELDDLHDVRLGVKRLRDTTRVLAERFDLRAAAERLHEVQNEFGALQDCACTTQQLEILTSDPTLSRRQAAVVGAWSALEYGRSERARLRCLARLDLLDDGFWQAIRPVIRADGTPIRP